MLKKCTLFSMLLMVADTLMKGIVFQYLEVGECYRPVRFFAFCRFPMVYTPHDLEQLPQLVALIVRLGLRLLMVALFFRVVSVKIHRLYRYAITLVVVGSIGNLVETFARQIPLKLLIKHLNIS